MLKSLIKEVVIFRNGMCAVFNIYGEQIPEYQGWWSEKKEEIELWIVNHPDIEVTIKRNVDF